MNSEEYEGICKICFEPIVTGQGIEFKESQNFYHKKCTEANPDSYYFSLDRIIQETNEGKNPTDLMDEMEMIFKIPALNNPVFNEQNPEVISLYRRLSEEKKYYLYPHLFLQHNADEYPIKQIIEYMKNHRIGYTSWSYNIECDACDHKGMIYYRNEEVLVTDKGFSDDEPGDKDTTVYFAVYKCEDCGRWVTYIE